MEARHVGVALATLLILLGVGLGFAPMPVPHRAMHISVAGFFVLLTPFALRTHYRHLWNTDPWDKTAWIHFVTFAILLYLVVHMLRHWVNRGTKHEKRSVMTKQRDKRLVVKYKGKSVDLTRFASRHPGGSVIWKAQGKDVETVWKEQGVSWHATNETVLKELEGSKSTDNLKIG